MSYSVMTTTAWRFDAQVLTEAFKSVERLTAHDAEVAAKHYEGVVAQGLDPESAFALQAALKGLGVAARVVDEETLPGVPESIRVKRVALGGSGLSVSGLLGPARLIAWEEIIVAVLAGFTKTRTSVRIADLDSAMDNDMDRPTSASAQTVTFSSTKTTWTLELFTSDGLRYGLENGDVLLIDPSLAGLGKKDERFEQLAKLVRLNASAAACNSRLEYLAEGKLARVKVYGSKAAYDREVTWLLWFMQGAPGFDG